MSRRWLMTERKYFCLRLQPERLMNAPRTGPRNLESTGDCYCGKVRKIGRCTRRDNRAVTSRRRGQVPKVDPIDSYGKSFKVTAIGKLK